MTQGVPLSTLLGQLVVAYTIEVDDLFEQRMPHSTTMNRQAGLPVEGPLLVSYAMWSNFLRRMTPAGTSAGELQIRTAVSQRALKSRLNHLSRWGYVTVEVPEFSQKSKYADHIVALTPEGQQACETFEPLPGLVEKRWTDRFGDRSVVQLRNALEPLVEAAHPDLPEFLPVIDYEMRAEVVLSDVRTQEPARRGERNLATQLAQALLLFTLDFEREPALSLPLLANVVRVLDHEPAPINKLPRRAAVSKEAVSAAITYLGKAGVVDVIGSGVKSQVVLTAAGASARIRGDRRVRTVEQAWSKRATGDVTALRDACEDVLSQGVGPGSAMAEGLRPHDGAWRTHKRYLPQTEAMLADPRAALPHHPMVLHRGGFPDGS